MRKREKMPENVETALSGRGLRDKYDARPPYQRNDYLLWINNANAQRPAKRLNQMLQELEKGGVYMAMKWASSQRDR